MVVDAEQHRPGGFCRRSEVHGRLPAPRTDLDEGPAPRLPGVGGGGHEGLPLVVGHEAPGGPGEADQRGGAGGGGVVERVHECTRE